MGPSMEQTMHTKTSVFRNPPFLKIAAAATSMLVAGACYGGPFFFSTGNPNNLMATASRPSSPGKVEIEAADDFALTDLTSLTSATFTGLLTGTSPTIGEVRVEIYRVFPKDSNNPPSGNVPTRVNSPSDVEFDDRDSTVAGELSFTTTVLNGTFTASNSIQSGGIHPLPNQTTGGNGPVTGTEVLFTVTFSDPFDLPADHYFFIPQVEVTGGEFLWLSASRPIDASGTPFAPDLQSWTRDANLDPDWLRVGTDIVGGATPPTFNAAFTLTGRTVPEPGTLLLVGAGMFALWWRRKRGD
jgi:hypothetical protein